MKGKICDWKDDKGFGFIVSENQSNKIFFHISDIETKQRRPKTDDLVDFDLIRDDQQRLKAKHITINGLSSTKNKNNVEPVNKNILDYIAIIFLFLSIIVGGFTFYQTKDLNKIILYGIVAVVSFIFLSRKEKPKEKILLVRVVNPLLNSIKEQYKHGIRVLNYTVLHVISNG